MYIKKLSLLFIDIVQVMITDMQMNIHVQLGSAQMRDCMQLVYHKRRLSKLIMSLHVLYTWAGPFN